MAEVQLRVDNNTTHLGLSYHAGSEDIAIELDGFPRIGHGQEGRKAGQAIGDPVGGVLAVGRCC
ncbi:hypothetical protein GCM10010052_39750 [Paenarthrobacter histidinolovorans]|nr:hypothetical protein GCM10010052_39750 [Paenarthrobacter histidinolovorans]